MSDDLLPPAVDLISHDPKTFEHVSHLLHDFKTLYDLTKSIYSTQLTQMATLQELQASQIATAHAVADLAARVAAAQAQVVPPAATSADLDALVQGEQTIQSSLAAIDPAPAPAA